MFNQDFIDEVFPAERTGEFFEALFGGAEDGAYDIRLSFQEQQEKSIIFHFELHQRPNQCLRCNLTTGLPQVFQRHPIINAKGIAEKAAQVAGFQDFSWKLGNTVQLSEQLHYIPLLIEAK